MSKKSSVTFEEDETSTLQCLSAPCMFPLRAYAMHKGKYTKDDLLFSQTNSFGTFRAVFCVTQPALVCCDEGASGSESCLLQPLPYFLFTLVEFSVLLALTIADAVDRNARAAGCDGASCPLGWELEVPHWGLVFVFIFLVLRVELMIRFWLASYADRLQSEYFRMDARLAWIAHDLGYATTMTAAVVFWIFHRDGDKHGPITDALYSMGFVFGCLELLVSRMPFVPAHIVWVFFIAFLDFAVVLAADGTVRYDNPLEILVATIVIIMLYGFFMGVAYGRDKILLAHGPFDPL